MHRKNVLAAAVILVTLLVSSAAAAEVPIRVMVNGRYLAMDVEPVNINGRVLIPARFVAEALGADVSWDGENRTVVVESKADQLLTLTDAEIADAQAWASQHKGATSLQSAVPPQYTVSSPSNVVQGFSNLGTLLTPWAAAASVVDTTGDGGALARTALEYRVQFIPFVATNTPNAPVSVTLSQNGRVIKPHLVRPLAGNGGAVSGIYYFWGVGLQTSVPLDVRVTTGDDFIVFQYDLAQMK